MKRIVFLIFVILLTETLIFIPGRASGIFDLPATREIDWSIAGVWHDGVKGIPTYLIGVTVTDAHFGAVGDGVNDDTEEIQHAINDCPTEHAVYFPAGTYKISAMLIMKSNIALRGAGDGTSILTSIIKNYANTNAIRFYAASADVVSTVTAGYAKGSSVVTVTSSAGFAVGDIVMIDQANDPALVINVGASGTCTWCGELNGTRSYAEIKTITQIAGNNITIDRPLYYNFSLTYTPKMTRKATAAVKIINSGLEYLKILPNAGQTDGILVELIGTEYCWVKKCDLSGGYGVDMISVQYYSKGNEIRGNFIHDTPTGYFHSGKGYGIDIYGWATDNLIEDNIIDNVYIPVAIGSMGGTANVIAYNWLRNGGYTGNENWWQSSLATHGAHVYMNLFEGNVIPKIGEDNIWGSGSHNVFFRNNITGENEGRTQFCGVVHIAEDNYYQSFVGNVIGHSGISGAYERDPWYGEYTLFVLGYWGANYGSPTDANVAATILRHGNYDYINNAVVWDAGYSDHDLPSSYYLSAKPSFFGSLPWPAYGPDVSGSLTNKIPAQVRYESGTLPPSDTTPPVAPTGVSVN